jgi:hypothetical protein
MDDDPYGNNAPASGEDPLLHAAYPSMKDIISGGNPHPHH